MSDSSGSSNSLNALTSPKQSRASSNQLLAMLSTSDELTIPTSGTLSIPPRAAFWLAMGKVRDPSRPRIDPDKDGMDCNDHAYEAVQSLEKDGRQPYYVQVMDEKGDPHLIAAYATQDGVVYARDSRADEDMPLQRLVDDGYKLIAASGPSAQLWYSFPDPETKSSQGASSN